MFGAEADLDFYYICRLKFEHRTVLQLMTCLGDAQDFLLPAYLLESQAIRVKWVYSIKENMTTNLQVGFQSS